MWAELTDNPDARATDSDLRRWQVRRPGGSMSVFAQAWGGDLEQRSNKPIFLSYSRKDSLAVRAVAQLLQGHGWSVWIDRDDIEVGVPFGPAIRQAIDTSPCVIVFWSANSVRSDWVRSEANAGLSQSKLVPLLLGPCQIPMPFDEYQAADLTQWRSGDAQDRQLKNLLGAVTKFVVPRPVSGPAPDALAVAEAPVAPKGTTLAPAQTLAPEPSAPSAFDVAYVVSDLVLYGAPDRPMGQEHRLARLIDHVIAQPSGLNAALVINGNLLDFGAAAFDGITAVHAAARIVDEAWAAPALRPVWAALKRLITTPGRQLVIVLGNSDMELALPEPAARLLGWLCENHSEARSNVSLIGRSATYRCTVGRARVLVQHGHHVDPWNVVDHGELARVGDELLAGAAIDPWRWTPNAGRLLQRRLLEPFARRYPFIEFLKPEAEAAVPCLFAIDPAATLRAVFGIFLDVRLHRLLRRGRRTTRSLGMVDHGPRDVQGDGTGLASNMGMASLLALAFAPPGDRLRRFLRRSLTHDTTFSLRSLDMQFREVVSRVGGDIEFIVTGHTRLERAIDLIPGRQCYYNTGTWARLIRMGDEVLGSPQAFAEMLAALEDGSLQALDAATVPLGDDGRAPLILQRPTVLRIAATDAGAVGELFHVFDDGIADIRLEPLVGTRFECAARA